MKYRYIVPALQWGNWRLERWRNLSVVMQLMKQASEPNAQVPVVCQVSVILFQLCSSVASIILTHAHNTVCVVIQMPTQLVQVILLLIHRGVTLRRATESSTSEIELVKNTALGLMCNKNLQSVTKMRKFWFGPFLPSSASPASLID